MSLTALKRHTVGDQLAQLRAELDTARSWPEREPFISHTLQITRVTVYIGRFVTTLDSRLAAATSLGQLGVVERQVIAARKIWSFFAEKFRQREDTKLDRALDLADDFAWACYAPLWRAAGDAVGQADALKSGYERKAPPLVYFHHQRSPLAIPQDLAFAPSEIESVELGDRELLGLMSRIPVPVVGMPWFQVEHLPELVLLAHEIGHLVIEDFELRPVLEAVVARTIDPARQPSWQAWIHECFCDVFAVACTGPAFALALMPYLADTPSRLRAEQKAAGALGVYPTRQQRMHMVSSAVEALGLDVALGHFTRPITGPKLEAATVRALWESELGQGDGMDASFRDDAGRLAVALLDEAMPSFGGGSLRSLVALSPEMIDRALRKLAIHYITRQQLDGTAEDLRVVLAAATLAYSQGPRAWIERNTGETAFLTLTQPILAASTRGHASVDTLDDAVSKSFAITKSLADGESLAAYDRAQADALFAEFDQLFDEP